MLRRKPAAAEEKKEVDGMMLVPEGSVTLGSDQADDIGQAAASRRTQGVLHRQV